MSASGGGATSGTSAGGVPDYQEDFHGLMLIAQTSGGKDWPDSAAAAGFDWDSTTYADNPSVGRFLVEKGLTEAGGNPYEGVSAPNLDDDITDIETRRDAFETAIDALAHTTDWATILAAVQGEQDGQVSELDVDAIYAALIDAATTRALQGTGSAFTQAQADARLIASTIFQNAGVSADDSVDAAMTKVQAQLATMASVYSQTDQGVANSRTAFDASAANAETKSNAIISSAITKAIEGALQLAGTDAGIRSNLSQYGIQAAADAETIIPAMSAVAEDDSENIVTSLAIARNLYNDLQTQVGSDATAVTQSLLSTIESLVGGAVKTRGEDLGSAALTLTGNVEASLRTAAKTSMASVMDSIDPKTSALMTDASNTIAFIARQAVSDAVTASKAAIDGISLNDAVRSFEDDTLGEHLRGVARFAGGMANANAVNSSAFIMGMAMIESDRTKNIGAYRANLELQLYQLLVPVYSDAFRGSLASYVESYFREISTFVDVYKNSDTVSLYTNVMGQFMQAYTNTMGQAFSAHGSTYQAGLASGSDFTQIQMSAYGESLRAQVASFIDLAKTGFTVSQESRTRVGTDVFKDFLGSYQGLIQGQTAMVGAYSDMSSDTMRMVEIIINDRARYYAQQVSVETNAFTGSFELLAKSVAQMVQAQAGQTVQTRIQEQGMKNSFVQAGNELVSRMRSSDLNAEHVALDARNTLLRTKAIILDEEMDRNMEYDFKSANWDMELFQRGGNVLSAISGAVVDTGKPSKVQSVLSGAFSGAGAAINLGTATGAITAGASLTPVGAGIAVLGGIAGAIAGSN